MFDATRQRSMVLPLDVTCNSLARERVRIEVIHKKRSMIGSKTKKPGTNSNHSEIDKEMSRKKSTSKIQLNWR